MQYEIKGGSFPVVICQLAAGEKMITESGSMSWMTPNMKMETKGGGMGKMFSKALAGESLFQNTYTAEGGPGMITFASSFPGRVIPITVTPGKEWVLQKSAFLASESGVQLDIFFNRKFGAGLFGGEGFIMQKLSGNGIAFAEIGGDLVEYELAAGQQMIVDTGYVAMMDATVKMDVQAVKGVKNALMGGEGFFNTVVTGPGRVLLQTMPMSNFASLLAQLLPQSKNG